MFFYIKDQQKDNKRIKVTIFLVWRQWKGGHDIPKWRLSCRYNCHYKMSFISSKVSRNKGMQTVISTTQTNATGNEAVVIGKVPRYQQKYPKIRTSDHLMSSSGMTTLRSWSTKWRHCTCRSCDFSNKRPPCVCWSVLLPKTFKGLGAQSMGR